MARRGADLLAAALVRAGVRRLFALSGNHVMALFDAALDAGLSIVHVRHEAAAVHMADAWGRLTGEPGVALVTAGPGHANALGALYAALAAESPLVLLSGHAPLGECGRGAFQELDQAQIAAPVAKGASVARSAARLAEDLARALRLARSWRPGPVQLSVPADLLDARVEAPIPDAAAFYPEALPDADEALESALDALSRARRPLVVAGPASARAHARALLEEFEEATGVPAVVMESPRGVNDPALGRLAEVLARADCALLAGKRRDFTLRFGAAFDAGCRVIEQGPCTARWLSLARRRAWRTGDWRKEVHAALAWRPPGWSSLASAPEGPLHPIEVGRAASALLAGGPAVFVSDGGEFGQWMQATVRAPRRLINGPAGGIGAALPFAAAAKLAFPDARVLAATGDGAFGFHCAELETALREGIAYIVLVGNDAAWNAEYQIQLRRYGEPRARGCLLGDTRYDRVAEGFGAHGERVARGADLGPALARAARAGRVACVDVRIARVAAPAFAGASA